MSADLPIKEFLAAEGVENWRVISDGACAFYATTSSLTRPGWHPPPTVGGRDAEPSEPEGA